MAQRSDPQIAHGEVIRSRREELDMTQEAIALAAETDQARISRVESGDNPSYGLVRRIARALGWTLAELVLRVEGRESHVSSPGERTRRSSGS
jgi:predicted transcriptional regulator